MHSTRESQPQCPIILINLSVHASTGFQINYCLLVQVIFPLGNKYFKDKCLIGLVEMSDNNVSNMNRTGC